MTKKVPNFLVSNFFWALWNRTKPDQHNFSKLRAHVSQKRAIMTSFQLLQSDFESSENNPGLLSPPKKTVILYFFIYQVLQYIHLWWLFNFAIHSKCPFSSCCPAGRTLIIWLLYTKLWNQVTSFWFSPLKIKTGWVLWCSKLKTLDAPFKL